FSLGISHSLPLHIAVMIETIAGQRHDMIYHPSLACIVRFIAASSRARVQAYEVGSGFGAALCRMNL
ncbi:MAG TPA: hypothetical protein VEB42_07405, partial [Chitinophagaceae bacterium]|nr:hypothetical protein [Chitinophagaceae bacterium]